MRNWITLVESAQAVFPTITFPENHLFHVGSMDANDKGNDSFEGSGLSVSMHPNAWRRIARIGGETWKLNKANNLFLDYHDCTPDQRQAMAEWSVAQGYAEAATYWQITYYDDEWDEERSFYCDTREDAEEEAESYDLGPEDVKEISGKLRGTAKLSERCRVNPSHLQHPEHLIATLYADDVLGLDGVWWEDELDTVRLSAPRGVIFVDKLASWHIEAVENAFDASGEDYD